VKSKLLAVNHMYVETATINQITNKLVENLDNMPLTLTFCHPDGLHSDEIADPNPQGEIGKS